MVPVHTDTSKEEEEAKQHDVHGTAGTHSQGIARAALYLLQRRGPAVRGGPGAPAPIALRSCSRRRGRPRRRRRGAAGTPAPPTASSARAHAPDSSSSSWCAAPACCLSCTTVPPARRACGGWSRTWQARRRTAAPACRSARW